MVHLYEGDYEIDKFPDTCPSCGKGISPIKCFSYDADAWRRHEGYLQIVFRCPREDCLQLFVAKYLPASFVNSGNFLYLHTSYIADIIKFEEFPDAIEKISPEFSKIYNQSKIAEENGLNLIAGPGYRKALEFLVKDYLITSEPDISDQVKTEQLAPAIKRIKEKRIEACASRAAWIGNDETHYTRKWGDKDIRDLKNLIKMVVDWIDLVKRSDEYEQAMPSKAPPETSDD